MRAAALLLVVGFVALGPEPAQAEADQRSTDSATVTAGTMPRSPGTAEPQSLTPAEAQWLLLLWEEERLALELYQTFSQLWGLPIFDNIAASETRHVAAVRTLVDRYGLTPEEEPAPGTFPALQDAYDDLLEAGGASARGALQAGVAIEEKDIADLGTAMSVTDNTDIDRVYRNLLAASITHLAAFTDQLGVESLTADEFRLTVPIVVSPETINVASQGQWVTVHADIDYSDVVPGSLTLNGIPVVAAFADNRGDLVAKFYVDDIKIIVDSGFVQLTLSGSTKDGEPFSGVCSVRVVNAGGI